MFTIYLLHDDYIMMDINQVYTLVISDGENVPVLTHDQHSNHHPFRTIHSALSTVIIDPHLFLTFPIFNSIFSQRHAPSMQIFHICIYIYFFFDILQTYPHKMLPTHYQTSMNPSRDVSSGPLPPGPWRAPSPHPPRDPHGCWSLRSRRTTPPRTWRAAPNRWAPQGGKVGGSRWRWEVCPLYVWDVELIHIHI